MTTLSIAVSVAVVMLDNIRAGMGQDKRHQLYVDFPFLCVGFLGQPSKPALEVITASSGVARLTFIVLPNNIQLIARWRKGVAQDSLGRNS